MLKICARLYLFLQCAICAQDLCKIVLLSPMRNIWARFAQDCTYFSNAQDLRKIVLLPRCAIYVQGLYLFLQCAIYAQDLRKIVLISQCARLYFFPQCAIYVQDCTYFLKVIYVQDLCKIVLLSPMCNICTRLQALFLQICHISHICSKFRIVFTS